MNCKKCGYELKANWNVCPKCSEAIEDKRNEAKNKIKEESNLTSDNDGKDKIYLIVFFISIVCGIFIDKLSDIGFLVALIAIVTGFIKYPTNRAIKVIFWIFLSGVIIYMVFILSLVFTCSTTVASILTNYRSP